MYRININYVFVFFIVFVLSGFFNKLLKSCYKSPRPKNPHKFLASETFMKDANGMPSGHTQVASFALTIAYLFTNKYLYESLLLIFITFIQRIIYNNHTILQLFVGCIVGVLFGISFYKIIQYMKI